MVLALSCFFFMCALSHIALAFDVYRSYYKNGKTARLKFSKLFSDAEGFTRQFGMANKTCFICLLAAAIVINNEERLLFYAFALYVITRRVIWSFFLKHQSVFQFKLK